MITYDEFIKEGFNPGISESEFNYIVRLIKRKVNYRTFNRFNYKNKEHIYYFNEIVLSVLLELEHKGLLKLSDEDREDKPRAIKSESIGTQKVEYVVDSKYTMSDDEREAKINKWIDRIIKEQLGHTGLMYRGHYAH
ncbi:hypothetical protein [Anaerococcus nagyae]|uniref:hypothetical protein n=1 Tax=Anaerococcus nagyae TaxID=1755241 RepID=UPI0032560F59